MNAVNRAAGHGTDERSEIEVADRIMAEIEDLAPEIAARASDAEAARRISADILQMLKSLGVFRMMVPRVKHGLELEFPAVARIFQKLAKIDGSVGWISRIVGAMPIFLPRLPSECYDEIYRHGPDVMFAGVIQPAGTAEGVNGGWRVNGRWPFASGCQDADWIAVNCVLTRDGQPLPGPVEGTPATSVIILPARNVRIEDTWHSLGMEATGSHHIVIQNVVVPKENRLDLADRPFAPGPLYNAPMHLFTVLHASLAVGMAEGAVDDIVAVAQSGRRQVHATTTMRDSEIFQYELGRTQAKLRGAQAMVEAQIASHWQAAIAGTLSTKAKYAEATQSAIWITEICLDVVQTCYTLGGGSAVFASAPLQRRLRDLEVAAQHADVQRRHYAQAGKLLLNGPKNQEAEQRTHANAPGRRSNSLSPKSALPLAI
jgi:indole-3-acetate monooxygenase